MRATCLVSKMVAASGKVWLELGGKPGLGATWWARNTCGIRLPPPCSAGAAWAGRSWSRARAPWSSAVWLGLQRGKPGAEIGSSFPRMCRRHGGEAGSVGRAGAVATDAETADPKSSVDPRRRTQHWSQKEREPRGGVKPGRREG